jgi:hypothetical protein
VKITAELIVGVALRLSRAGACLLVALSIASLIPAKAEPAQSDGVSTAPMTFHIASQPLSDALYAYSSATGIEVLIPGDVIAHRQSPSVVGTLTPEAALRALLAGSGLVPHAAGNNAITLRPGVPDPSVSGRIPRFPHYSAALQTAVTDVLCELRTTRPGGYRVAVRLWVNPSGEVTEVGVLGTTGDVNRDETLSTLLKRVAIGMPPPAGLLQPTTLVVLPRQEAAGCVRPAGNGMQGPVR